MHAETAWNATAVTRRYAADGAAVTHAVEGALGIV